LSFIDHLQCSAGYCDSSIVAAADASPERFVTRRGRPISLYECFQATEKRRPVPSRTAAASVPRVSLRVAWISHCPVKGLAVRRLDECELTEAGVTGDREFFLVDENDRLVNSKGLGALQQIVPRHDREAGSLTLRFPDGTTVTQEIGFNGSLAARFWSETVEVRVVDGPWSEAISDFAGRDLRLVSASGPAPDRRRSGAATLLGTGSLRALARILGVDEVDERRFRMNFGIDGLGEHQRTSGSAAACGSGRRSSFRKGTSAAVQSRRRTPTPVPPTSTR
jgi:MOSC domain-containing protein